MDVIFITGFIKWYKYIYEYIFKVQISFVDLKHCSKEKKGLNIWIEFMEVCIDKSETM